MTRWIFIRHGESEANAGGWLAGHQDVDLTPRGVAQAVALREPLGELLPAAIFSSDLKRARRTAELALPGREGAIRFTAALRERTIGTWEGTARAALVADRRMQTLLSFHGRPPGGESQADLARRALDFLADQRVHGTALVFAHAGMIRVVVGLIDQIPHEEIGVTRVGNAEQVVREVSPERLGQLLASLGPKPEEGP